jgi:DNA-binding NarL/FixJ family response regulator
VDVLLAIHQLDLRLAIDLFLREEPDINVVGVASETEGLLALLYTTHPELLLLDWAVRGRPLAEMLAELHEYDRPPKVIGLGVEEDREAALAAGVDVFVVKGESTDQLLNAIRQLVIPPD